MNSTGTQYGKEHIEEIEPAIPTGWIVSKPWAYLSTTTDVEGWQYGANFHSVDWFTSVRGGCKYHEMVI